MRSKVFRFNGARLVLLGFAGTAEEAETISGAPVQRAYVKHEGYGHFVPVSQVETLATWNKPLFTPQVPVR